MSQLRLVIAEKPSVARSIATVLNANERKDGFFMGSGYIVSWCFGHLIELAQPDAYDEKYAKWRYADLPIVPVSWKHNVAPDKEKQVDILRRLMFDKQVDTIVNACDAGREGELIFRLVYEHCGCDKPIKRLWISSMEDSAIAEGFKSLRPGIDYERLYQAALSRSQADWIVGINATRLFSILYGTTLNVGRVQSPTLAMLVEREKKIAAFTKEPFFTPEIELGALTASGEKIKDKTEAEAVCSVCDGKTAIAVSVQKQDKTTAPPKLYDLTTLQREANRLFGYTAQQTLDYVQSLYEKKLATYPRTDSQYLTEDMAGTAGTIVNYLQIYMPFAKGVSFTPKMERITDNSKVTDHHAIIPTLEIIKADLAALPAGERDILMLIANRLLCATAEKHSFQATTATFECSSYSFTAKGKTILNNGWKAIDQAFRATLKKQPEKESDDDKALPQIAEGQTFDNVRASIKEGFTSPPKSYTEDTLLSAMENAGAEDMPDDAERKGLGTPATRAGIIEKLVKTGFIERSKKNLLPTDKGNNLIAVLPATLTSPLLTAEWEHKFKQIERGQLDRSEFMSGITAFTKDVVLDNKAPNKEYISLFLDTKKRTAPPLGVCPRCGSPVRESEKGFFCDSRTCGFKLWRDNKFWTAKKKPLTAAIVAALLKDGRIDLRGLYSEKTGKNYDATIILDDTGDKYVNFKMEFSKRKAKK